MFNILYTRILNRAKKIQNKAVVNESPTDRLIRELKEENAKLMAMLKKQGSGDTTGEILAVISINKAINNNSNYTFIDLIS